MLALELEKTEVKSFMGKLLREGLFDGLEARVTEIGASVKITIDGTGDEGFCEWAAVRPLVYEIIKQTAKPRYVKVVFSRKAVEEIHSNAKALFLNLVYENDGVTFTTACAQKEFAMDKTLDIAWDNWVREFFSANGLAVQDRE